jgi:hypothetical protein
MPDYACNYSSISHCSFLPTSIRLGFMPDYACNYSSISHCSFLVQILMGLYRYNTRLITYYNSRRDLLSLWEGKAEGLKALDQVLAPPKIDFGKEPKHPLEDIIRAAGAAIQKTAARKGAAAATPPAT